MNKAIGNNRTNIKIGLDIKLLLIIVNGQSNTTASHKRQPVRSAEGWPK
jgi:hypothetical protein